MELERKPGENECVVDGLLSMNRTTVRRLLEGCHSAPHRHNLGQVMHLIVERRDAGPDFLGLLGLVLEVDNGESVFYRNREGLTVLEAALRAGCEGDMIGLILNWEKRNKVARIEFLHRVPIVGKRLVRRYFRSL
ncbi:hypothetical protein BASA81_008711 [Batrachochytrium salamandrivorans]|nr:hypothetical protein BASA81_008711 [Batrachochytrium salamandrivorans]